MLDRFFAMLADLSEPAHERFGEDDYRLAAAVLLVHVMAVDGRVSAVEKERLRAVLSTGFDLSGPDTDHLIESAMDHEAAGDTWTTQAEHLANRLDEQGRRRIVDMMWAVCWPTARPPSWRRRWSSAPRS